MPILRATASASAAAQARARVDAELVDLLRRMGGHFLDVHAAFARGHQGDALRLAVHHHAEVELLPDVGALLDQQPLHHAALRGRSDGVPGACRAAGRRAAALRAIDRATFTPPPLPRPPAWICALTHPDLAAELRGRLDRLVDAKADESAGRRHAVLAQHFLALVFVDLHGIQAGWVNSNFRRRARWRAPGPSRNSREAAAPGAAQRSMCLAFFCWMTSTRKAAS